MLAAHYGDEVLNHNVRIDAALGGPAFIFMDDNVSFHRGNIDKENLEGESSFHMEMLAYCLDHKPIENLWDAVKCIAYIRVVPPTSLRQLESTLMEE